VTGHRPYEAETSLQYAMKQVNDPIPHPSLFVQKLPKSVEQAILRATARRPGDRFQSMREFGAALRNVSDDSPTLTQIDVKSHEPESIDVGSSAASTPNESIFRRILRRVTDYVTTGAQPPESDTKQPAPTGAVPKPTSPKPMDKPSDESIDEVSFTAYYPKEGKVDTWHTLLVYAHVLAALETVRKDAQKFEDEIKPAKVTTSKASTQIARGTDITIVPACAGITFNPAQITFKWAEDFYRAHFRFKADQSLGDDAATGQISIHVGPLIIGTLKFAMLFNETDTPSVTEHEEQARMYPTNRIFISYSHKDTDLALMFRNVLEAVGYDVLLDIDDLRAGQVWNDELMRMIERADIFQLFWSQNSSQSEYCRREWEHALKQNKPAGFIRPIYWQKPLPTPPDELSKFHFDYVDLKLPST